MVSNKEMWLFLGVLLLSGYHSLPEEHHYWCYCGLGQQKVCQLEFRRQVTLCLLKADEKPRNRSNSKAKLPQDMRFDRTTSEN